MKIIQMPDVLHEYLTQLIEAHAARGIHPEEGMAISRLWDCVKNRATTIPDAEIEKMVAAGSPSGQSLPQTPECQVCYNEDGSLACVRTLEHGKQHSDFCDGYAEGQHNGACPYFVK